MTRLSVLALLCCAGANAAVFSSATPGNPGPASLDPRVNEYRIDDGTAENSVGLTSGGNIVFLNRFTANSNSVLNSVSIGFGTPVALNGQSIIVGAWAVGAGSTPGARLGSVNGVVANASAGVPINNITLNTYNLGGINLTVGQDFYIGFIMNGQAAGQFPGAIDQTAPLANRSYVGLGASALDPNNLAAGLGANFGAIEVLGGPALAGNWVIRGNAVPVPAPGAAAVFGLVGVAGLRRRR